MAELDEFRKLEQALIDAGRAIKYPPTPNLAARVRADLSADRPRQPDRARWRPAFIVALAVIASLLIVAFRASVTALVPLWAIGVFLSFTLSQAGMARRWWKSGHLPPGLEVRERGSTLRFESGWPH